MQIHHACNSPAAIEVVLQLGGDIHTEDDYHMTGAAVITLPHALVSVASTATDER